MKPLESTSSSSTASVVKSMSLELSRSSHDNGEENDAEKQASSTLTSIASFRETPDFLSTSLGHLRDSIEILSPAAKQAFAHVQSTTPTLLQAEECHVVKFLRATDFNPWQAGQKVVKYWEYRKTLFQNEWLERLENNNDNSTSSCGISGNIMKNHDAAAASPTPPLQVVPSWHLPNGLHYTACGTHARYLVLEYNENDPQHSEGDWANRFMQSILYHCSVASDVVAQRCGVTFLCLLKSHALSTTTVGNVRQQQATALLQAAWKMVQEAMPIKLLHVILVKQDPMLGAAEEHMLWSSTHSSSSSSNSSSSSSSSSSSKSIISRNTIRRVHWSHGTQCVTIPSFANAAAVLQDLGLPSSVQDALPVQYGGLWTADHRYDWKRVVNAVNEHHGVTSTPVPWLVNQSSSSSSSSAAAAAAAASDPTQNNVGYTNPAVAKQVCALQNRKYYKNRKAKQDELASKVAALQTDNERLQQDNTFLESLLEQANSLVALAADPDDGKPDMMDIDPTCIDNACDDIDSVILEAAKDLLEGELKPEPIHQEIAASLAGGL